MLNRWGIHFYEIYGNLESEDEEIDPNNYKGIYFADDPGGKWQDPVSGAHFKYQDMVSRLEKIAYFRRSEERKHERLITN